VKALLALALWTGTAAADSWEVRVPERLGVQMGSTKPVSLELACDRGTTISKDAAVIIDLAADEGIAVKKPRLSRADAADPEADAPRFAVPVRGDALGEHALRVRLRFWACAAKTCRPVDVRRTVQVTVIPGESPAP
jgi:hypothetical protein